MIQAKKFTKPSGPFNKTDCNAKITEIPEKAKYLVLVI